MIYDSQFNINRLRLGLTLVEILIVVALLGILTAVVLPEYQNYTQKAKESTAKENLHILRAAIERYASEHNGVAPGYPQDNPAAPPLYGLFYLSMIRNKNYLSEMPSNPFNKSNTIQIINNDQSLPAEASGQYGWIYKPATKEVYLDWPGIDSQGTVYYQY